MGQSGTSKLESQLESLSLNSSINEGTERFLENAEKLFKNPLVSEYEIFYCSTKLPAKY